MLEVSPASSTVHFTSLSPSSVADFQRTLDKPRPAERAIAPGHGASAACHTDGILALLSSKNIPLSRCCLLDPKATEPVAPGDSELFDVFLFGGILGDDPPLDRTRILRREGFPSRHLGPVQMTTDTALAVTKRVVVDGSESVTLRVGWVIRIARQAGDSDGTTCSVCPFPLVRLMASHFSFLQSHLTLFLLSTTQPSPSRPRMPSRCPSGT